MFLFQEFQDRFQNLGHILEEVCKVDSQKNKSIQSTIKIGRNVADYSQIVKQNGSKK